MRRYETIYILRPALTEEQVTTLIENTTNIIQSDNGQIIELDKWGMKKLSYPIKKESLGFYVYCDFAGSPDAVAEMERKFRIDDSVLRYLTVKISDVITAEEVATATAELADRKAAAAQASEEEEEEGELSNDTDDNSNNDED
jgi:small subunit ribosomal protein S6